MVWNKRSLFFAALIVATEVLFVKVYELVGPPFHFGCQPSDVFSDYRCAVTFVVVVMALAIRWYLCAVMATAWWRNRLPSIYERALWAILMVLAFPGGLAVYYFIVYRRLDRQGQYRMLSRV
jgi:hypothetical protein